MTPLQEKFQITVPGKETGDEPWASFEDQRDLRDSVCFRSATTDDVDTRKFNQLPPGMEIDNQLRKKSNQFPLMMAGQGDVSNDTNPEAFEKGFTKRHMDGTDDQYTGEHMDLFYGDSGGFAERNNYLDRE